MISCDKCGFGHKTFEELRACKSWAEMQAETGTVSVNKPRYTCPICGASVAESYRLNHQCESAPPKGDVAAPPQPVITVSHGAPPGRGPAPWEAEAPAEPVAHQPVECRSRYCSQHRDIWRHYEDVIAKAEPVAPPTNEAIAAKLAELRTSYDSGNLGWSEAIHLYCVWRRALEQSAPPPDWISRYRLLKKNCYCPPATPSGYKPPCGNCQEANDIAVKHFAELLVQGEQASPTCTVCGTAMVAFDANGTSLGTHPDPRIICEYRCLSCKSTTGCTQPMEISYRDGTVEQASPQTRKE
jgi:hypothetical protein